MSQGHHIPQKSVEVGQNPAFLQRGNPGAEGTAGLAVSGEEVNPAVVKGGGNHPGQLCVKVGEKLHQVIPGLLGGEGGGALAHGGKQVVPGKSVPVAQSGGLGLQILAEFGKILFNGPQHGVQGLPLHIGVEQGPVQRGTVAPEGTVGNGFHFDGVQGVGNGVRDGAVAAKLRFIGVLPDLGVRVVGLVADGGQIGDGAPIGDPNGAGQVLLQLRPGVGAGDAEPGGYGFPVAGKKIFALFLHPGEQEGVVLEHVVALCQGLNIQTGGPGLERGLGSGGSAVNGHDLSHFGAGFRILGVRGLPQLGIEGKLLGSLFQIFQNRKPLPEPLGRLHIGKPVGKPGKLLHLPAQGIHIGSVTRIVKAVVDGIQIPFVLHCVTSQK